MTQPKAEKYNASTVVVASGVWGRRLSGVTPMPVDGLAPLILIPFLRPPKGGVGIGIWNRFQGISRIDSESWNHHRQHLLQREHEG